MVIDHLEFIIIINMALTNKEVHLLSRLKLNLIQTGKSYMSPPAPERQRYLFHCTKSVAGGTEMACSLIPVNQFSRKDGNL